MEGRFAQQREKFTLFTPLDDWRNSSHAPRSPHIFHPNFLFLHVVFLYYGEEDALSAPEGQSFAFSFRFQKLGGNNEGRLEISTCYASGNCIKIKEETEAKTLHFSARLVCKHSEEEEIDWAIKIRRRTRTRRHPTAEFVMMIRRLARQWIEQRRTVYANDVEWALSEFGIRFGKQIEVSSLGWVLGISWELSEDNFLNDFKMIPRNLKKAFEAFKNS